MAARYASNKRALGLCDVCGFQYRLKTLRNLIVKGRDTNVKACNECWQPSHPQLDLGRYPVNDPQALRDPRPDFATHAQSRAHAIPLFSVVTTGFVGTLRVEIE